jgi:trans-2,3-dihydro-3-hydroxyanthranilate isomerase
VNQHRYALADVFTDKPLAGNQLAVFLDAHEMDERLLQPLAREMNLSETVFVFPPERGGTARVRYLTTVEELDFAGHPTLGTAAILANEHLTDGATAELLLETNRADISVSVTRNGPLFTGWMQQPIPAIRRWDRDDELLSVLGVSHSRLPIDVYDNGIQHLYVTLDNVADVLAIVPDFPALGKVCGPVRINVFAGFGLTYTSRMFSPFDVGVPEDPACGSAAKPLAAHLVRHGDVASGLEVTISQGEKVGRPSTLYATATTSPGSDELAEVRVGGSTVIVGSGTFAFDPRMALPHSSASRKHN